MKKIDVSLKKFHSELTDSYVVVLEMCGVPAIKTYEDECQADCAYKLLKEYFDELEIMTSVMEIVKDLDILED